MKQFLMVSQMVLSVLIIIFVLLQARGTGMGRSGSGSVNSFTRRGLEKFIFRLTFICVGLFLVVSTLSLLV